MRGAGATVAAGRADTIGGGASAIGFTVVGSIVEIGCICSGPTAESVTSDRLPTGAACKTWTEIGVTALSEGEGRGVLGVDIGEVR